tara:strand:- start:62 stop:790 length:729 start_codon:yes stop_codon:yes gene_type:complete
MNVPTVYLATCDNYLNALKATQFLFHKFWPSANVVVLGYKTPDFKLNDNWKFVSMGTDLGVDKWSNGLIEYFNSIDDTHIIFAVEDCPPIKPVNTKILHKLLPYINDSNVGKITLTEDLTNRPYYFYDNIGGLEIIKTSQTTDYRLSTQYAVWRRDYFLKYLKPNMNAWQFELDGSKCAINDGYDIIGTYGKPERDYVIHSSEAIRRGNFNKALDFRNVTCKQYEMKLDDSIIEEMKTKNII